MKKLILLLAFLLIPQVCYGGLIAIETLSSDSDATFARWNNSFNTIKNEFNGNIESANIKDDSLLETDFADSINPRVRWDELFNDITVSGMLPPTASGTRWSTTTAGVSYVQGYRIVTAATANQYTASKDTYLYIDINGTFHYEETTNGGTQPTTPANSLLLAKVVTSGTEVTSVSDLRTTSISIAGQEDHYRKGFELVNASPDTTQIVVNPGVVYVGITRIEKLTTATLDMDTDSNWADGSAEAYTSNGFCFVGIDTDGNIKLLGTASPDCADTDGNTAGTLRYKYTNSEYWRVIGQVAVSADDSIIMWRQEGNRYLYDRPQTVTGQDIITPSWSSAISCQSFIPATSTEGIFQVNYRPDASDTFACFSIRANGDGGTVPSTTSGNTQGDLVGTGGLGGRLNCMTSSTQYIQHSEALSAGADLFLAIKVAGYIDKLWD